MARQIFSSAVSAHENRTEPPGGKPCRFKFWLTVVPSILSLLCVWEQALAALSAPVGSSCRPTKTEFQNSCQLSAKAPRKIILLTL